MWVDKCSNGPLPLRGPHSGPAAAGCSLQQSTGLCALALATLAGGAECHFRILVYPHHPKSYHGIGG